MSEPDRTRELEKELLVLRADRDLFKFRYEQERVQKEQMIRWRGLFECKVCKMPKVE